MALDRWPWQYAAPKKSGLNLDGRGHRKSNLSQASAYDQLRGSLRPAAGRLSAVVTSSASGAFWSRPTRDCTCVKQCWRRRSLHMDPPRGRSRHPARRAPSRPGERRRARRHRPWEEDTNRARGRYPFCLLGSRRGKGVAAASFVYSMTKWLGRIARINGSPDGAGNRLSPPENCQVADSAEVAAGPPFEGTSGWLRFCFRSIQYSGSRCACAMAKIQIVSPIGT